MDSKLTTEMRYEMKPKNFFLSFGVVGFLIVVTSCVDELETTKDGSNLNRGPCDPFEETEVPVELGRIIIVGEDSGGRFYLVEEDGAEEEHRVFVSSGSFLYRQDVRGAGHGSIRGLGENMEFSIADGDRKYTVIVEIDEDGNGEIAVVEGDNDDYEGSTINSLRKNGEGEILEVVAHDAISKMELVNLPGTIRIEYLAEVDNGKWIVVVVPEHFFAYDNFRFFYGEESRMEEYEILEVLRASDGGSTHITIRYGDTEAEVYFPVHLSINSEEEREPASLKTDGEENLVNRLQDDAKDMEDFTFYCIL